MEISRNSVILTEFIDNNMDKEYPFVDRCLTSGGFSLPTSFIADLKLIIGLEDSAGALSYRYNTRISNVTVFSDYIYVTVSCLIDNIMTVIAKSDPIPTDIGTSDTIERKTIQLNPTGSIPVNGTVVIGSCQDINKFPGSWGINDEFGYVFPANVCVSSRSVTGVMVDGRILTGIVKLEAGDNITLDYNEASNTITISLNSAYYDDDVPFSDRDLLDIIIDQYGQPIVAINGVLPSEHGNIDIKPTDCMMIETNSSAHSISLYNPCGSTCASEDFMQDTYDRISDLNKNYATLVSFYNSVSNVLAQMGVRVSAALEKK